MKSPEPRGHFLVALAVLAEETGRFNEAEAAQVLGFSLERYISTRDRLLDSLDRAWEEMVQSLFACDLCGEEGTSGNKIVGFEPPKTGETHFAFDTNPCNATCHICIRCMSAMYACVDGMKDRQEAKDNPEAP